MELLTAYTRPAHYAKCTAPYLLYGRAIGTPLRMPKKPRFQRDTRHSVPSCANATPQGGIRPKVEDAFLPSVEVKTESDRAVAGRDILFDESFGQTVYVEKGEVNHSDTISAAPALCLAEVVPETPSFSLVRQKPSADMGRQRRRILTEVLTITIPAMAALMADPLMSLVDTGCVGQISAIDLAALGPNTAIFNMIAGIFSVMAASTANRMARNSVKSSGLSTEEKTRRREDNERVLSHSLVIGIAIGISVMCGLIACGPVILRAMGTASAVMKPALQYLYIRALSLPACIFMATSQGACLGQQDMWTPMKVMLLAGVINLMGDIALIIFAGLGTVGAAAATTASQIAGALFFFFYLRRGGDHGEVVKLKWRGLPDGSTVKSIVEMARVLVPRCLVLMATYTGMTTVATATGTLTLAAHQVTLQIFWLLATIADAGSLTAQSLIARDRNDKRKIREISWTLVKMAAYAGMILAAIQGCALQFFPQFFSSDRAVISAFQSVIPQAMLGLIVYPVCVTLEGISIGMDQMEHFSKVVAGSTAMTMFSLWATQTFQLGLYGVWTSAVVFFALRTFLQLGFLAKNWAQTAFGAWDPSYAMQVQFATS